MDLDGLLRRPELACDLFVSIPVTTRQWKTGLGYGLANLDKGGTRGETRMLLARLQWIY